MDDKKIMTYFERVKQRINELHDMKHSLDSLKNNTKWLEEIKIQKLG